MHRSVNARVILVLAGTLVVLGGCVHFLHAFQMKQNAGVLARQAQRALAQGELRQAAKYLDRYLAFVPGDTAALAQLGQVLDRLADGPVGRFQALQYLEQALRREPEHRDLRRRVVALAIDQYQFQDALVHLQRLLASAPESEKGELEHLAGWCHDALEQSEEAIAAFRRAIQHEPGRVAAHALLAEVLAERLGRLKEAGQVMNAVVAANPHSTEALLARARFLLSGHDRLGAARDIRSALELLVQRRYFAEADQVARQAAGDGLFDGDLARLSAEAALAVGDRERAVRLAREAVPGSARDYRAALWLARLLDAAGRHNEAAAILRASADKSPRTWEVWAALVAALAHGQNADQARAAIAEAQGKLPPERLELGLAHCWEALGDLAQAERYYRDGLARRPGDLLLLRAASDFFIRSDQPDKAEPLLRRLLEPKTQCPADYAVRARRQLARLLAAHGSEQDYQDALAFLQVNADLHGPSVNDQRARALVLARRSEQRGNALNLFDASLKDQPLSEEDAFTLAQLCAAAGQEQRADQLLRELLATNPNNARYLAFQARELIRRGNRNAAQNVLSRLERIEPQSSRTAELRALAK
jgi:predicted Zn-dependent protease